MRLSEIASLDRKREPDEIADQLMLAPGAEERVSERAEVRNRV